MKKAYIAPMLFVDMFAADTMIASGEGGGGGPKNDNAGNNQNCWACDTIAGYINDQGDVCLGPNYPGC